MSNPSSNTANGNQVSANDQAGLRVGKIGESVARILHGGERVLLVAGLLCVLVYVCTRIYAGAMYQAGLWSFSQLKSGSPTAAYNHHGRAIDFSMWDGRRVVAYKQSLATRIGAPLAILSIPRLRLDVPVFEGTDALTLNRGAGRIAGTAQPGEQGNIGVAAHRDGFFRSLKDIHPGDQIDLVQLHRTFVYTVDNITVVDPGNVEVLRARAQPSLTLVTCYPFYFIGDAPQRYIVQASLVNPKQAILGNKLETSKPKEENIQ